MTTTMDQNFWQNFFKTKEEVLIRLGYESDKEFKIKSVFSKMFDDINIKIRRKMGIETLEGIKSDQFEGLFTMFILDYLYNDEYSETILDMVANKYKDDYEFYECYVLSQLIQEFHFEGEYSNVDKLLKKIDIMNSTYKNNTLLENYCLVIEKEQLQNAIVL